MLYETTRKKDGMIFSKRPQSDETFTHQVTANIQEGDRTNASIQPAMYDIILLAYFIVSYELFAQGKVK